MDLNNNNNVAIPNIVLLPEDMTSMNDTSSCSDSSKNIPSEENPELSGKSDVIPSLPGMINAYHKEMNYNAVDIILEKEKQHNKTENWNKLDKTGKILKLHAFAEKYGKMHNMPVKEIKALKIFFIECLEKEKLQKVKDVIYNKETHEIVNIPSLHFNTSTSHFTLKIMDSKRISTMKSLTPKRTIESISSELEC